MLDFAQTKLRKLVSTMVLMKAVKRKRGPGAGNLNQTKDSPSQKSTRSSLMSPWVDMSAKLESRKPSTCMLTPT